MSRGYQASGVIAGSKVAPYIAMVTEVFSFTITLLYFILQAEDGIRGCDVTGVQTCGLPIWSRVRDRVRVVVAALVSVASLSCGSPSQTGGACRAGVGPGPGTGLGAGSLDQGDRTRVRARVRVVVAALVSGD